MDYLLDLDWNSGQDEEPSKEPDNERSFQENTTLLGHHSTPLLGFSDRTQATSDWIVDMDLDSDTDIMDGIENPTFQIPNDIYSPGSSPDICSSSSGGFDMLLDEHEAASSAAFGSRDILCADMAGKVDFDRFSCLPFR